MKVYKWHNETFEVNLELILYRIKDKKSKKKTIRDMLEKGHTLADAEESVTEAASFCTQMCKGGTVGVYIDLDSFSNCKHGSIALIQYLQHEIQHFKARVLDSIAENTERTDIEAHLRISDWAFKKCMSTKFFKSLLK